MLSLSRSLLPTLLVVLALSARPVHADTELISDGSFDKGQGPWTLDTIQGAKGALTIETGPDGKQVAHIQVPEAADVPFHVQLFQNKIEVKKGQSYTLSFRARATPDASIGLNLMFGVPPWTNLWRADAVLTADWQTFSFDIKPTDSSSDGRITFTRLGAQAADYWIADVSLIAKDAP